MDMTFPRERNGHVDSGKQIIGIRDQKCPNCGSLRYRQTVSTEDCPDCGLHYDYWGDGSNQVYTNMMASREASEKRELFDRQMDFERKFRDGDFNW